MKNNKCIAFLALLVAVASIVIALVAYFKTRRYFELYDYDDDDDDDFLFDDDDDDDDDIAYYTSAAEESQSSPNPYNENE